MVQKAYVSERLILKCLGLVRHENRIQGAFEELILYTELSKDHLREAAQDDVLVWKRVVQGQCLQADLDCIYEADACEDSSGAEGKRDYVEHPPAALPLLLMHVPLHVSCSVLHQPSVYAIK